MASSEAASSWHAGDIVLAAILAVAAAAGSWQRSAMLHPVIYQYDTAGAVTSDVWFDADIPRAACLIADRLSAPHQSSSRHPLISLAYAAPAAVARAAGATSVITQARSVAAMFTALWIAIGFAALRAIGHSRLSSGLFAVLLATSAAGLFATAAPEVHLVGAATLLLPLIVAASRRLRGSELAVTAASAASLSITVTNWISGLVAAWQVHGARRGTRLAVNAFVVVSLAWVAQALWFPGNVFFVGDRSAMQVGAPGDGPRPLDVMFAALSHSIVMPRVAVATEPGYAGIVTVQHVRPGSSGAAGTAATALWAALLTWGAIRAWRERGPLRNILLATLAAQLAVHLVIGDETFLFAAYFAPLTILVASFAALDGARRRPVLVLVAMLIVSAGANNWQQFRSAAAIVNASGTMLIERGGTLAAGAQCR